MKTPLYIDSREPPEFIDIVKQVVADRNIPADVVVKELDTGDIVYGGAVFERKEASDFVSSITEGRLSEQSSKMCIDFDENKFVLLEGDPYGVIHSNLADKSIVGMFCSLAFKKNIKVVPVKGMRHSAFAVARIIEYIDNDEGFNPSEFVLSDTGANSADPVVSMLATVEGISVSKAQTIVDDLGMETVDQFNLQEAQEIDGIGPVLANRIHEIIFEV